MNMAVLGYQLKSMISEAFSNINDSMIRWYYVFSIVFGM